MKLGIISDCIHYPTDEKDIFGSKVHVYVRQIEALASKFEKTILCVPIVRKSESIGNEKLTSYKDGSNIIFKTLPNAGGNGILAKLKLLFVLPIWIYKQIYVCYKSDIIYLRSPNNVSITGFLITRLFQKKCFATYTGTWAGYKTEPLTYKLQRTYLKKYFNHPVFVYGKSKEDHNLIFDSFSPSYDLSDWIQEKEQVESRINRLEKRPSLDRKIFLLTVGSLSDNKNQIFLLRCMKDWIQEGRNFHLYIAGDGIKRTSLEQFVEQHALSKHTTFLGNIKQNTLRTYYRKVDFVIQSPKHEGFGKVPVEAFFHGVIPIISNVNLSERIVGYGSRGRVFNNKDELSSILSKLINSNEIMLQLIKEGRRYSKLMTIDSWVDEIIDTIGVSPKN